MSSKEIKIKIDDPVLGPVFTKIEQEGSDWGTEIDEGSIVVLRKKLEEGKYPSAGENMFAIVYSRDANSEQDWDAWEWELPTNVCFVSNLRGYSDRDCEEGLCTGWEYKDFFGVHPDEYEDIIDEAVKIISYVFEYEQEPCNIIYEYSCGSSYENVYDCADDAIKEDTTVLISSTDMQTFLEKYKTSNPIDEEAVYKFVRSKLTDDILEIATKPTYGPLAELPDWAWSTISLYDHSGQYWYREGTASTEGWDTSPHAGIMYVHPDCVKYWRNNVKESKCTQKDIEEWAIESIDRMCHVFSSDLASKVVCISVEPTGYYDNDRCGVDVEESLLIFENVEKELESNVNDFLKVGYEKVPFSIVSEE